MHARLLALSAAALALTLGVAHAGPSDPPASKTFLQRLADAFQAPADPTRGQPSEECGEEDAANRPGQAQNAPGSAFNPDGKAGTVYAGERPQNSKNPKSVSQYDVACFNVSNRGPGQP